MIKTNDRIVYIFFFLIYFMSCSGNKKEISSVIDNKAWNKATIEFLNKKCDVDFDSLKLGGKVVPVQIRGKFFETMKEYIEYCLKHRTELLKYLNMNNSGSSIIHVYERYDREGITYIVELDNKRILNFIFSKDSLLLNSEKTIDKPSPLFKTKVDKEVDCFSEYESIPQRFWIFNNLESDKLMPNKITLSN